MKADTSLRILQIAPQFPFPATDGGKISIAANTREFARLGAEVTLFAVAKEMPSPEAIAEARQFAANVEIIVAQTGNTLPNIAKSFFSKLPLYVDKLHKKPIIEKICEMASTLQPDIIHAEHTNTLPLAVEAKKVAPKALLGLRLHNIEWVIWRRFAERFGVYDLRGVALRRQAHKLQCYEAEHYPDADICFPISEAETQRAKVLSPQAKFCTATAGADIEYWQRRKVSAAKVEGKCLLATTFTWQHNIEAVHWYCKEVLPKVSEAFPATKLHLLGKNPPAELRNYEGVEVHGFVPDAIPHFEGAVVYVAPLFVGGGIRIKILEAMAMELPVVATSISAEGISATEKDGLFIADDADTFAKTVAFLLKDSHLAAQLGAKARLFVEQRHTWQTCVEIMLNKYCSLLTHGTSS